MMLLSGWFKTMEPNAGLLLPRSSKKDSKLVAGLENNAVKGKIRKVFGI
jgi:hypothetical protein